MDQSETLSIIYRPIESLIEFFNTWNYSKKFTKKSSSGTNGGLLNCIALN